MKIILMCVIASLLSGGIGVAQTIHFDNEKIGALPAGWEGGVTGSGAAKWEIVEDSTAPSKPNVLKQSGQGTYPWCVKKDVSLKDGFVEQGLTDPAPYETATHGAACFVEYPQK